MKTRSLLLVGIGVFVLSLLLSAPVALLYGKLAPHNNGAGVQASGLDGTLFEGHASSLLLNGQPVLNNLHWRFRPLSLLLARAAFHLDSSGALTVDGQAAKLVTGGWNIDQLRAAGPLKQLLRLTGDAGLPVDGQFGLKLDSARFRSGFVSSADGELTINGLKWTLAREPVVLGDFLLKIATEKALITAKLEPLAGPLDVGGEIRVKPDRSYEVDLQVKTKPAADALVQNLVRSLGQPDAQGYFHLRTAGSLGGGQPAAGPAPGVSAEPQ